MDALPSSTGSITAVAASDTWTTIKAPAGTSPPSPITTTNTSDLAGKCQYLNSLRTRPFHVLFRKCYEVRCRPAAFSDKFGNHIDRSHACYDPEKSIIVSIVDTCPCYYPGNHYSNSRWCCQDQDHLDLSNVAFDQLAEQKWGVIGIEYRPVECPNGPAQGYYPQNHYGAPNQQVIAFDDKSRTGK